MSGVLSVKCPQCKSWFSYYDSVFRPFCSDKCKMIDLGHWFHETYTINTTPNNDQEKNEEINQEISEESEYS